MRRAESNPSTARSQAAPVFERTATPTPPASEPAVEVVAAPAPVEITLDDEVAPRDQAARRRAAQRALTKSVERPSDILPDFPETNPASTSTMPSSKKTKTELQLGQEAKDLANAQLESLL
jgi:hypothetical protein